MTFICNKQGMGRCVGQTVFDNNRNICSTNDKKMYTEEVFCDIIKNMLVLKGILQRTAEVEL